MADIQNDQVVSFHYTLTDENGTVIDKSEGQPLVYLHGAGNIIPGLENALTGKNVGDKLSVNVAAAEGYGEYNAQLVQEVPRNMFQGVDDIQAGMQFQAQTDDGIQIVTVKDVNDESVFVDGNHPLAGQNLNFDVEIVDIRPASQEELDHGHVHGAGGHHH
ncbi:peptidylprolyl isomerase [Alkanindiges hydrocarboniclasticus]|jgi:FKBP-type peptidyl-prolyl cis-trans isomerase SlyD|uniref:Peptidyl-prolyl cis-trans isomerase n=1 Tax=Alkanindiges hydrocarboniclasticus TaxID=1907941 RepID=A0A1S8CTS7_9GAMM|nr:peptidylprolyl isomerase [Alkanindiges hydrocarboniclasticus]ONG39830.1 peptidylprolyl isomerase [Alkanindiges hydrocarboniclasticus]